MSKHTDEKLLAGVIFGDAKNSEYLYLPGGEIASEMPCCVFEHDGEREDVPLETAAALITRHSLRPCAHPLLGKKVY